MFLCFTFKFFFFTTKSPNKYLINEMTDRQSDSYRSSASKKPIGPWSRSDLDSNVFLMILYSKKSVVPGILIWFTYTYSNPGQGEVIVHEVPLRSGCVSNIITQREPCYTKDLQSFQWHHNVYNGTLVNNNNNWVISAS